MTPLADARPEMAVFGGKFKLISSDQWCYAMARKCVFSIQIVMEELEAVESYLLREVYPSGLSKGEKANLRQKCKNNFNLEDGILYYRKAVADGKSCTPWRICVKKTKAE